MSETPGSEAELVAMLAEHKFQGPLWDRFADQLARTGLEHIEPWIASKVIFVKLREKQIRCRRPVEMNEQDVVDLATETVARAIDPFREKMLMSGRWDPDGKACLRTLFITQCLYQFPNAYRTWMNKKYGRQPYVLLPGDEEVTRVAEISRYAATGEDPEAMVITHEHLEGILELLPDRLRAVVQLVAQGYSFREAAELHGENPDSLQRQLWRLRPRLRRLLEQRTDEEES